MSALLDAWRHAPTQRKVWALAAPMILSNLSVPMVALVDSAVVGHLPHAQDLAAVVIGSSLYGLLVGLMTGKAIARATGQRDRRCCGLLAFQCGGGRRALRSRRACTVHRHRQLLACEQLLCLHHFRCRQEHRSRCVFRCSRCGHATSMDIPPPHGFSWCGSGTAHPILKTRRAGDGARPCRSSRNKAGVTFLTVTLGS